MVDWDQVERLRSKGWDWSRIAADERAEFTPEAASGDAGRQLRTLYYQRRSKAVRKSGGGAGGDGDDAGPSGRSTRFLRIGYAVVPLFGIWFVFAYLIPSPFGIFVPWLYLLIALLVAAGILLYALLTSVVRWETAFRTPLVLGVVLGFVAAGGLGVLALAQGCPTLSTTGGVSEPQGWAKYSSNPDWAQNGAPVFFFYGSVACPYCSASSWAMTLALQQFGTLSGQKFLHSSSTDVYPNTPEIDLSSAHLVSRYVALNVAEGTDDTQITTPSLGSCQYTAYVQAYSGGSIPFVVIEGRYVHATQSLVDPKLLQTNGVAMSDSTVQGQMNNQSGPAWDAISPGAFTMMAILYKVNGNQPSSLLTSYPQVNSYLTQLQ